MRRVGPVPPLFPRPRQVDVVGPVGDPTERAVQPDPGLPRQGYRLDVGPEGATIRHADAAGLRYARHTLAQLAGADERPALVITDHPDLARRGFMLDISRDRVPTTATLDWLVEVLAALRFDHLELYVEHTYAYRDHPEVWRDASPITADELRQLDDRCAAAGIELVVNQNTFGHMERWLRHDAHRWRAECPDGATNPFTGRPMPPATLAPTPANADFALALVREQAAQVRSRTVHIGADEPFELGQGASAAEVAARGRTAVYLEHLQRLLGPLVEEGRTVLFWGDLMRRDPAPAAALPEGAVPVIWHYDPPAEDPGLLGRLDPEVLADLGLPDGFHRGFAAHLAAVAAAGRAHWVAPGTSTWNSVVGRCDDARANVLDAAAAARSSGAEGLLLTDWGDNGHLQPLVVSLLPMVVAAGAAWCASTNADLDPTPVVDRLAGTPGLGALLADVGTVHRVPGVQTANASALFAALDPGRPVPLVGTPEPGPLAAVLDRLDAAVAAAGGLGRLDVLAAVRAARHGAWRLAQRAGLDDRLPPADQRDADAREVRALHAEAWAATSRPGGLVDSLRHLPGGS